MENIIEPNKSFDFSKLSLAHPSGIQGGAYFTKILHNNKPLYIQTVKSLTRQGLVKSGKKYYCDLMFDNNAENLINWFENLEEKCQKLIFEKGSIWFQNTLEETDIESAFNSTIRVYKSGKYYLVRTNIKNNQLNLPAVKIYNENEVSLSIDDITTETNIISILEIQGIKFTARNFQIEIELKQIMVLDNEPLFDNCLIKTSKQNSKFTDNQMELMVEEDSLEKNNDETIDSDNIDTPNSLENDVVENMIPEKIGTLDINTTPADNNNNNQEMSVDDNNNNNQPTPVDNINVTTEKENMLLDIDIQFEDLDNTEELKDLTKLKEVDLDITSENNLETFKLKKPNVVYFELYKEARNKAKAAKKAAIIAYLEAKNIKKTYMLEDLDDSDCEFDTEIDEVSESELDGL